MLKKIPLKIQEHFFERLNLFTEDQYNVLLNNHSVDKAYAECRSINITGDYRAIFKKEESIIAFIKIGTHSELYS